MTDEELLRYSRHILLPGFDLAGQERLASARVLVVGAGGLGNPVALYLAASGVGQLVVADGDRVETSNLQRQVGFVTADVGRGKAEALAMRLRAMNPHVQVEALGFRLEGQVLQQHVAAATVVVDCSDNFATRLAVNRACVNAGKPLVSGAAIRTEGQVAVFNASAGSPCYACLYGEQGEEDQLTCSESGVLSPLVGVIGAMQAAEVLKLLAGFGETLDGSVLVLDLHSADWRRLRLRKDPCCPVCGER